MIIKVWKHVKQSWSVTLSKSCLIIIQECVCEVLTIALWLLGLISLELKLRDKLNQRLRLEMRQSKHLDQWHFRNTFYFLLCTRGAHMFYDQGPKYIIIALPGKWLLCHHLPGGKMSRMRWWSCELGSSCLHRNPSPKSAGTGDGSSASWSTTSHQNKQTCSEFK